MDSDPRPVQLRRGSTLLELAISLSVLTMVLGMGFQVQESGRHVLAHATQEADMTMKARHVIASVSDELALLGIDHLFPQPTGDLGQSSFFYRRILGTEEGEIVWSPLHSLAFEHEPGEMDDGLDNDGDGLADEGCLVMTRGLGEVDEQRTVLCRGVSEMLEGEIANGEDDNGNGLVDEPGFHLTSDGDLLRLRLTLLRSHADGLQRTTVETALGPRN